MISKKGFTALEILIVVAILTLLGAMSLVSFTNSRRVQDLVTSGSDVLSILRLAQAKALAGEAGDQWGVRLEQSQYILFRGAAYAGSPTATAYALPGTIEIVDIALAGGGQEVVFRRLDGATAQAGTLNVRVQGSASQIFAITIDGSGRAYQTGTAPVQTGARVIDARHRAFAFSWGIDDAVSIIFTFSNPTDVRTAVMTPAPPRTSYDSGTLTFTVGGFDQVLRVHAVSLSSSGTLLSIDRDCRKNNKKVAIAILDGDAITKEIATYEADCRTVTVGAYGGVMSEP